MKPMIVAELITWLQRHPSDAVMLYQAYSDYQPLQEEELSFSSKDDKDGIACHKDHWMRIKGSWRLDVKEALAAHEPTVDAVVFPGN